MENLYTMVMRYPSRKELTIEIDASFSSDTKNDQNSLRYIWRIDNVPVYEGENRDLSWPDNVESDFLLSLEVIDDDSASSMISIKIVDGENDVTSIVLIVFILSCLFLIYAASKRSIEDKNIRRYPKMGLNYKEKYTKISSKVHESAIRQ